MKIAFFSDNFYPELSGIADSILTISARLSEKGHWIRIYAPRYSKKDHEKANRPFKEIALSRNVSVKRLFSLRYKKSPTGQSRSVVPFFGFFKDLKNFDPDIIHCHLPFSTGLDGLLGARILGKPLVGTSHTPVTEFLAYSPFKMSWMEKPVLKWVSWFYNQCDFVSAPSRTVFEEMAKYGFKKRSRVISNPIDVELFSQVDRHKKESLKKELGLANKNIILYTGRLAKEKNIDMIIKALGMVIKKIPNTVLVIAGHGAEDQALKELSRKIKLDNDIIFTGTVPLDDLVKYHRSADVFAIMSTAETQSIGLMLSFAVGVPAVVINKRALPEYVGTERGFIVEDYPSLAEKIILLLTDQKLRESMGNKANSFVQDLSAKNIANIWEKVYFETIKLKKNL